MRHKRVQGYRERLQHEESSMIKSTAKGYFQIECIINAFTEVEKHDLRVNRVVLDRKTYNELSLSRDFMNVYANNPELVHGRTRRGERGRNFIGDLWGAGVELGDESKVFSEPGFVPLTLETKDEWFPNGSLYPRDLLPGEPSPEYSIDIDFTKNFSNKGYLDFKLRALRSNLTIIVKSRADLFHNVPKNEWRAVETLREMISETEFRKYMKYGFILVNGQSGCVYQIFRRGRHTKVWFNGEPIEEICSYILDKNIPPTDKMIAFKVIIETDEEEFRKMGNVYNMRKAA